MLSELRVRDLGVIEDLTLSFGSGMTALTGETGAGKTLVVEALQLVLGGRADVGMVRAGAAEALVEARFVSDAGGGGGEAAERRGRGHPGPLRPGRGPLAGMDRRAHGLGARPGRGGGASWWRSTDSTSTGPW